MSGCVPTTAIEALHVATAIYTAAPVVESMLDRVGWPAAGEWPAAHQLLMDPSAGDGAFLVAAIARLDVEGIERKDKLLPVRGYEIHYGALMEARLRVAKHLQSRGWHWNEAHSQAEQIVRHGDFLDWGDPPPFDIIIGNPPYLRFNRLPDFFKAFYERRLPRHAKRDLQHAFLDRCADLLAPDGRMAFITADRWLFNDTAADLREEIGRRVGLIHVQRLDVRTSFYRPKHRVAGSPPRIHPVEVVLGAAPRAEPLGRHAISPDTGRARESAAGAKLGDVAEIRLGPWLGPKGIFVVDEMTARRLPADHLVRAIMPRDIAVDRDELLGAPRLYAIRTTAAARPPAPILRHLRRTIDGMPDRGRQRLGRSGWWVPPEAITLPLDKPCLVVPRISNRLRVIDMPAGVLPLNHAMTVVAAGAGPDLAQLRAYLRSKPAQDWVKANAARLENGFMSITTTLLRRMPAPKDWRP